MDKNNLTGIILITLIVMGYFMYFGNKSPLNKEIKENTVVFKTPANNPLQIEEKVSDTLSSALNKEKYGELSPLSQGESKEITLENKDIKVILDTKGGLPKKVLLKKYLTNDKKPLWLINESNNKISWMLPAGSKNIDLNDLYFVPTLSNTDTANVVTFRASIAGDKYIEQVYSLAKEGFITNYSIKVNGLDQLISNRPLKFVWKAELPKLEHDLEQSRIASTINYYKADGEFDYLNETSKDEESAKVDNPIKWVSMKQKFFNAGIIAEHPFKKGFVKSFINTEDTVGIKSLYAELLVPASELKGEGNFQFYFGPNHFQTLRKVTEGYHKNVYLGWPVINWVNRFIVIPVFNFLQTFIPNYGIIIIILVLLIKLILFPLSYKSYVSMAKMKVLKPELDEIKAKFPDDQQKQQTEQMALYGKVGINPISGCIPVLLSMPILLAMFNFFPNSIELRQQSFLWAHDLSTYDAPIHLPFTIPFYGSHVSLFTLLMTISTLVYTWFNNQMSTVTGPMKSVSYIMPVIFLFVLNSFPAGLSFYYFVSNIVTIGQQILIRSFVDEGKIRLQLEETKKKNAETNGGTGKKSKWMQRVEEAMKMKEEQKRKSSYKQKLIDDCSPKLFFISFWLFAFGFIL